MDEQVAEKINKIDYINMVASQFHALGLQNLAVYVDSTVSGQDIIAYGSSVNPPPLVKCEVITKPNKVEWGYDVIQEKALYHAGRSMNFQLHGSEETELVYKILELAGVVINKVGLAQTAANADMRKTQQEKA